MNNPESVLEGYEPLEVADRNQVEERARAAEAFETDVADAEAAATDAPMGHTRLLTLPALDEPRWKRNLFTVLGLGVAGAFFFFVISFFAPGPGTPGIDENAYLVAGKSVAQHFTPGINPATPYGFVGPMWVRAKDGWYYPKYPAGVPVLGAVAIWIGGGHNNLAAVYVSPVCAALAVLAMFFLTRTIAGSFLALLGAIALATNSTMLHLALIPSSHAPDICFVLWGMYALVSSWKSGKLWVGIAAGFLLGYAVTIRYSEALLLFPLYPIEVDKLAHPIGHKLFYMVRFLPIGPLGLVCITGMRWKKFGSYLRAAAPLIAWAVPVGLLVWFNWRTLHTITGYDATRESTGFTIEEFKSKWEYTIQELYLYGMFFVLPMGILGMLLMFARAWKMALLMVLWFVPSVLLYTAYYWGENSPGVGYLRFFLALFPPIIASSMFLIKTASRGLMLRQDGEHQLSFRRGSIAIPIGAGLFTAMVAAVGIYVSLPDMERQHTQNEKLAYSAKALVQTLPVARHQKGKPDPVYFAEDGGMGSRLIMYLQFAGDGDWYTTNAYTVRGANAHGFGGGGRPPGAGGPGGGGANNGGGGRRFFNGGGPGGGGPGGGFPLAGGPPGAGGSIAQAEADQQAPVLFDPERRKFIEQLYEKPSETDPHAKKTQADLQREEAEMLNAAFDGGRPVYAVLTPDTAVEFTRRLGFEGFDSRKITWWKEPADPPAETDGAVVTPPIAGRGGFGGGGFNRGGRGNQGGGPGGPGFGGNQNAAGLSPPSRGGRMGESAGQQTLQVIQIVRKPVAKPEEAPLLKPATRPATLPVASR